jgi:predicted Zn-dependent protease
MVLRKLTVILFSILTTTGSVHAASLDEDAVIFQAMEAEMARSLSELKVDVFEPPYFINYQIRHHDRAEVAASFGALVHSDTQQHRTLFVDVKVGDPKFDSSTPQSHRYSVEQLIPVDNHLDSLRRALWYETDLRYKQAIVSFLRKKGRFISGVESHDLPDFSKGKSTREQIDPIPEWKLDMPGWERSAREVSDLFKEAPEIEKSRVKIFSDRVIRYYYDSEGNKIRDAHLEYGLSLEAWTKTAEGTQLHDQKTLYFRKIDQIPPKAELVRATRELIASLKELKAAPQMDPYVGPAIFSPDAAAVLFHEAIGHRLEGDRLRGDKDGKTFLKKIGQRILPEFVTVVDNPVLESFQGTPLIGNYRTDDQGQQSREVVLIDHGVLKSFLLSRTPVLGFNRTNGHARSDGAHAPMSRMSNFVVKSDLTLDAAALKQRLIEEVKKQNKPYGLFVKKIVGGETQTDTRQFQVFKGKPLYLYKVFSDGREELVRGVDFVGTPLSMISKILITGNDPTVINGFCTAESGVLPVASITPSVLLSEVELQASHQPHVRRPILNPPHPTSSP